MLDFFVWPPICFDFVHSLHQHWNTAGKLKFYSYCTSCFVRVLNLVFFFTLTLILLTWRIWWASNNASKWQMGFNSAFKGLSEEHIWERMCVGIWCWEECDAERNVMLRGMWCWEECDAERNMMLRGIFWIKRDKVAAGLRKKVYNGEFDTLYCSQNIVRVIKGQGI
jgi:hypothetical protein